MATTRNGTYEGSAAQPLRWMSDAAFMSDPRLRERYRDERGRLHAARVLRTYSIFIAFALLTTGLEILSYPAHQEAALIACAAYLSICVLTITSIRSWPQWTTGIAVVANNALVLCVTTYYLPSQAAPEACAMTLVLFLATLPLLNGAGGAVQALSCFGAMFGFPLVLIFGAAAKLPISYLMTAIFGATGVSILGAWLLDRERWIAFCAKAAARRHQADLAHVGRVSLIGEMAAGLAHELNQPLAAIVNFTRGCQHRLRANGNGDPDILRALDQASAQALRAAQIIRRIRDFIRKEEPRLGWVDVNELVRNVAELADTDGRQQDVHIQLALNDVPRVYANSIQIEQVILNLMRNGFDAMDGQSGAPKTLSIETRAHDVASVDVTVADTGSGLSGDVVDRIFDPFFTTKPTGLGLGLSISRSIIEAHGGRLWVEPNPVGGSRFHFSLSASNE